MTAPTSQKLADALNAAGFDDLALRARANEFHEYLSPHALPLAYLADILAREVTNTSSVEAKRLAAHHIRMRLIDGEFDADEAESADWAMSPEGQEAFRRLKEGE